MEEIDSAIVIGTIQVKNNNSIVKMFTKSNGLFSVYLLAGSKKKSVKNAVVQPLTICNIRYLKNKKSALPSLKEARIDIPLLDIQTDVFKSTIALFIADFLDQVLSEDHEEKFYKFIENALRIFNEIKLGKLNYHLAFLIKISKWLGVHPTVNKEDNNYFDLKEGVFLSKPPNHPHYFSFTETQILAQFLKRDWTEIGELKLTGLERRKLLNGLVNYYIFHVPGFKKPKSLSVLEEVFN